MIELFLLALLCFFVTASIGYELDGGLKASLYCIQHGETQECFNMLAQKELR